MRIVDAPLAVRVYARFADTLRLLSDGAWWQTPMSRPGYVLGAVVVLTYVTTLRAALWLVLLAQLTLMAATLGSRPLRLRRLCRTARGFKDTGAVPARESLTSWQRLNVSERTRRNIELLREINRDGELVIGRIDRDGRVLGLFGPLPGMPATTASEYRPSSRFQLDVVLIGNSVLVRKNFRGDRIRFCAEWATLTYLAGKVNVPAIHHVDEDRAIIYKHLVLGKTVRDLLVEAGARILSGQTAGDPDLQRLPAKGRRRAIEARATAGVLRSVPKSLLDDLERQIGVIHGCGVTGVSHTFQNVVIEESAGIPWLIDCENGRIHRSTSGWRFRLLRDYERSRFCERYGRTPQAAASEPPSAAEVLPAPAQSGPANAAGRPSLSVVTPTLRRPQEVAGLLADLTRQRHLPSEIIVVDGAPASERETEEVVAALAPALPVACRYIRCAAGTAIQRNAGIDAAHGDFIAFVDDDIRLDPAFFEIVLSVFRQDADRRIGAVTGYITNTHLDPEHSRRWRWYRRLRLFTTYEPGRYDFATGYPINRYLQPAHEGLRPVDVMGAGSAVWRREAFADGLRFSPFFCDFGVLEDAHLALRARRRWMLMECGRARCTHLRSPTARIDRRRLARKTAVNYRFVFMDIVPERTLRQEIRFWLVQGFDLGRYVLYALRRWRRDDWWAALGKLEGIAQAWFLRPARENRSSEAQPTSSQARSTSPAASRQMRCAVISHKRCWVTNAGASGYASTGGFPIQMEALADLFESTTLLLPGLPPGPRPGERVLRGRHLKVIPLTPPPRVSPWRALTFPFWLARNGPTLLREIRHADAVHALIPGDVGTVGMLLALAMRKRLLVRHCGNWFFPETIGDVFGRWLMRRFAGGRNVMLATGGGPRPASGNGGPIHWTFATSLTEAELEARVRQRSSAGPAGARLIIVCRQEPRKGTASVIRSLPLILRRFPEARLDVVGTGSHLANLQALARSLGVNGRVTFHGQVSHDQVMSLLGQADLFCYPTAASEGFPKAVLEALACGLPVVATPVSVLPSLLGTGCGILLAAATPAAVAEAVGEVLGNPQRYAAMAAKALHTAGDYSLERWREGVGQRLREAWGP